MRGNRTPPQGVMARQSRYGWLEARETPRPDPSSARSAMRASLAGYPRSTPQVAAMDAIHLHETLSGQLNLIAGFNDHTFFLTATERHRQIFSQSQAPGPRAV